MNEEGVWVVVHRDYYETIERVFPEEIDALRHINKEGYGSVRFIPWGKSIVELNMEEE